MNVLIVEDEPLIARALARTLKRLQVVNTVKSVHDYQSALDSVFSVAFDLVLVDICLGESELTGLDLCDAIRRKEPALPIIVVTSMHSLEHLERAFDLGVNDYITKPFQYEELLLRAKRWFATNKPRLIRPRLRYQELVYDAKRHEFFWNGVKIDLSKRNKDLLLLFVQQPEQLLRKEYLKEKYWGDYSEHSRNLRSSVQELRKSLDGICSDWIQTVRGEGYILQKGPD